MHFAKPIRAILDAFASHWREGALLVLSVLFTYVALDVGYRIWQYKTLPDRLFAIFAASSPTAATATQTYIFDEHTGYRYPPDFEGQRGHPWFSRWHTNSHGHVSKYEYPVRKPAGEFRIALVGDSFTANITNNVRWNEVLEDILNADPVWRGRIGGKFTRVINFGIDGMGMEQFGAVVQYHALQFEPDLVIVNFISDDLLRRLRYVNPSSTTSDRTMSIRTYIDSNILSKIRWWRPYPELLAATLGSRFGMKVDIPVDARSLAAKEPNARFEDRGEAVRASAHAMRTILGLHSNVLFFQAPLYHELENVPNAEWIGLVEEVGKSVPEARIVSMRPAMEALLKGKGLADHPQLNGLGLQQIMALSVDKRPEIYRWFFLPDDVHYTDYGTTLYAQQVARYLVSSKSF